VNTISTGEIEVVNNQGRNRVRAVELLKKAVFRHTRLGKPQYPFNIEPIQIATLICEIERLKEIEGAIVEIGVARGMTTRFLCEHIVKSRYSNQSLVAIDTFSSFLPADIDYEITRRGETETKRGLVSMFGYNDYEAWKRNFKDFPFVRAFQGDCATFDYSTIAPIKLTFLDVDLYLPNTKALPKIYENTCKGGAILVDDVQGNFGARAAYLEFCDLIDVQPCVIGNKCGVVRK
jgi:hypothetical protein